MLRRYIKLNNNNNNTIIQKSFQLRILRGVAIPQLFKNFFISSILLSKPRHHTSSSAASEEESSPPSSTLSLPSVAPAPSSLSSILMSDLMSSVVIGNSTTTTTDSSSLLSPANKKTEITTEKTKEGEGENEEEKDDDEEEEEKESEKEKESSSSSTVVNSVQNPFLRFRVQNLKVLEKIGFELDQNNEFRIKIASEGGEEKIATWIRKISISVREYDSTQKNAIAGGKSKAPSYKKWERQLLDQVLKDSATSLDNLISSEISSLVAKKLEMLYEEGTRGNSRKFRRDPEADVFSFSELTQEQKGVIELITKHGFNTYLGGNAGSGKTVLLKSLFAHLVNEEGLNVALCASTGVSSVLIGGRTFHSTLNVPQLPGAQWDLNTLRSADVIICDEVSMLPSLLLDQLDAAAQIARSFSRVTETTGAVN